MANGEHPLMIRVCKDNKKKYRSLGVSVKPEHWDFEKNKPKNNCPHKDLINKIILDKELEFQKQILELKADNKEFTASTLIAPKIKVKQKTVEEFFTEVIEELKLLGKLGNAKVYDDSYTSLKTFTNKKLDIPFSHIDIEFLKKYEMWMRKKNFKDNSMSLFFRTLRSLYNRAIQAKHAKKDSYLFNDFKVSKFSTKTEKRAIPKDLILQIMDLDLSSESWYVNFSRDMFIFSYLCGGINMTDVGNLKSTNIVGNRLVYIRDKTGKKISIPLSEKASSLIEKYKSQSFTNYLFPFLNDNVHKSLEQKYNRKKKVLRHINYNLRKISEIIGVEITLTTYVARHSYATVLKNSGVNIALIGETLGHSDLKTTQIYLDSFENRQIDEALENLL